MCIILSFEIFHFYIHIRPLNSVYNGFNVHLVRTSIFNSIRYKMTILELCP